MRLLNLIRVLVNKGERTEKNIIVSRKKTVGLEDPGPVIEWRRF